MTRHTTQKENRRRGKAGEGYMTRETGHFQVIFLNWIFFLVGGEFFFPNHKINMVNACGSPTRMLRTRTDE